LLVKRLVQRIGIKDPDCVKNARIHVLPHVRMHAVRGQNIQQGDKPVPSGGVELQECPATDRLLRVSHFEVGMAASPVNCFAFFSRSGTAAALDHKRQPIIKQKLSIRPLRVVSDR
jgi:hypothetical protein